MSCANSTFNTISNITSNGTNTLIGANITTNSLSSFSIISISGTHNESFYITCSDGDTCEIICQSFESCFGLNLYCNNDIIINNNNNTNNNTINVIKSTGTQNWGNCRLRIESESEQYGYPTFMPSNEPSLEPSAQPSLYPTTIPTIPTEYPTQLPSQLPSQLPTAPPTKQPTELPTKQPTELPSLIPSVYPTTIPTAPTEFPTQLPSNFPSYEPSSEPSDIPSTIPTRQPTGTTIEPTDNPTLYPSQIPTDYPSDTPSDNPTSQPTEIMGNEDIEIDPLFGGECDITENKNTIDSVENFIEVILFLLIGVLIIIAIIRLIEPNMKQFSGSDSFGYGNVIKYIHSTVDFWTG